MDCDRYRESVSARLDGENLGIPEDALDRHLQFCWGCRAFAAEAANLNRTVRVAEAPAIPDQTQSILHSLSARDGDWSRRRWRVLLAVLAVSKLAVGLPKLVSGLDGGAALHTVREVAVWEVAMAVALLLAAWRPVRAVGLLPLVGVAVVVTVLVCIVDLAGGRATVAGEVHHLVEVVGLVALWRLAGPIRPIRVVTA